MVLLLLNIIPPIIPPTYHRPANLANQVITTPFTRDTADFSAERTVVQIEYLQKRYKVKYLKLWEDNFAFDNKKLHRFCNLLLERKIKLKWDVEARATLT